MVETVSNGVIVLQNWYDANSRRIAKQELVNGQSVKTLYLYDGWDIVAVMNGQGQLLESYTRGVGLAGDIGTIVAMTHHSTASSGVLGTFYVHHNHRGDVIVTRSVGGGTVGTYGYSAFGALTYRPGSYDVCRFKFSSKERDLSSGLYYYGYRFYAPQWQRWIKQDQLGELGGINLYGFVHNNPTGRFDELGLMGCAPNPCQSGSGRGDEIPEALRDWLADKIGGKATKEAKEDCCFISSRDPEQTQGWEIRCQMCAAYLCAIKSSTVLQADLCLKKYFLLCASHIVPPGADKVKID